MGDPLADRETYAPVFWARSGYRKHATAAAFLAFDDGVVVGRVAVSIDHAYEAHQNARVAFSGFYEAANREGVAEALFLAVEAWARERGAARMLGPFTPSPNYGGGLLVDGFGTPCLPGMPNNPSYYDQHFTHAGYAKAHDFFGFRVGRVPSLPDEMVAQARALESSNRVSYREINRRRFFDEAEVLREIYNDAFSTHWGHSPIGGEEWLEMAKAYRARIDPALFLFVLVDETPVGFCVGLPDGRRRVCFDTLGIRRSHRHLGLGPLLYLELFRRAVARGFEEAEFPQVLDNNRIVHGILDSLGAERYRTYRLFEKAL
jgi:GNAT superfamily N-acetyltransferase